MVKMISGERMARWRCDYVALPAAGCCRLCTSAE